MLSLKSTALYALLFKPPAHVPACPSSGTALEGQVEGGVRVGGSDEYVCDEEEESLDEPLVALAPEPEPEETADLAANELEEAGADMNDFRVGGGSHAHARAHLPQAHVRVTWVPHVMHVS